MTWRIALAFIAAGVVITFAYFTSGKVQRHHTYWCQITVCIEDGQHRYCQSQADVCGEFRAIQKDV